MKLIISILLLTIVTFARNITYLDGTECECDSISVSYYESGEVWGEYPYKNGKFNGLVKYYYASGNIEAEYPYKNDRENGIGKQFYESGNIKIEYTYKNNRKNGITKWYFESGKLAGTANYKNGTLTGYKKCTDGRMGNENLDCFN